MTNTNVSRIALGLAIVLTLVSGLLHGRMTQRWGYDQRLDDAAQRLALFPATIGDWQQENSYDLSKSAIDLLACRGYISRGYRNLKTGDYVKLAVMVGPGAKMSIHVPEICYESNNFTVLAPRSRFEVKASGAQHAFWSVLFQINDVSQQRLRVLYGWSDGGDWVAPRMPRWSVAGAPLLYKLQLSYATKSTSTDPEATNPQIADFLQHALPALAGGLTEEPAGATGPALDPAAPPAHQPAPAKSAKVELRS
jgi:hypothetical protein